MCAMLLSGIFNRITSELTDSYINEGLEESTENNHLELVC